ncbi:hypothetical protein Y1Q_0004202 [Alligator mississippiensis]|uniref:SCAN box domain-containing protein n=1 Tax=Alligator mississippiensis TaxID=8496 RepID=A0A151NVH4_ALLMI|nr:hypothetical protein Y1Q_0004202 [Alligator mississippiensis]
MTSEDDPKAYIEAFECHAILTGLDKVFWAGQLGALVVGKAQAAYQAMPRDEVQDYDAVKTVMLYRLEINPEHYQHKFWAMKGAEERSPDLLLQLLRDLFGKWINLAMYDREAVVDQIILEQFLDDLEGRTHQWVRQHSTSSCEEALKLAEAFAASEGFFPKERRTLSGGGKRGGEEEGTHPRPGCEEKQGRPEKLAHGLDDALCNLRLAGDVTPNRWPAAIEEPVEERSRACTWLPGESLAGRVSCRRRTLELTAGAPYREVKKPGDESTPKDSATEVGELGERPVRASQARRSQQTKEDPERGLWSEEDPGRGLRAKEDSESGLQAKEDLERGLRSEEDPERGLRAKEVQERGLWAKEDPERGLRAREGP